MSEFDSGSESCEVNKKNDSCSKNKSSEEKEVEAAEKVINALLYYKKYVLLKLKKKADSVNKLPMDDRLLLSFLPDHFKLVREATLQNQKLIEIIVNCGVNMLAETCAIRQAFEISQLRPSSEHYMSKVKSTLKQIVRDWAAEGMTERKTNYDKVLQVINKHFSSEDRHEINILVPGAGLGRLAWELLRDGFSVTGNEFSIFMLLTSNFILNTCHEVDEFTIYPYVMEFSNSWSYTDQLRPIKFPDVSTLLHSERKNVFSMCAGDFLQAYEKEGEKFDCVATVFFLDTAANPITYIRTIHRILKTGGIWVNFGPLTYHFEDSEEENSLELPFDELVRIIGELGFHINELEEKGINMPVEYVANASSMLKYTYECGFFKCTKL
uniref:carnosine N-methyltransferase n=1 Tax=Ditylenchus dipsaci TaxID=166011 RepID=A0A915EHX1_9BILA